MIIKIAIYVGEWAVARGGKREGAGRKPKGVVTVKKVKPTTEQCVDKICTKCGKPFTTLPMGKKRKICFVCSQEGYYVPKGEHEKGCKICQTPFSSKYPHAKYCSDECYRTANIHRMKQRGVKLDSKDRTPRPCAHCGTIFELPYRSKNTVYCSKQCRTRAHAGSGCCHRRRAKKFGVEYQYIHKHKVFVRDGWKCKICGVDTPKELKGTREDNAPELDHIVPLAKGGPHLYSNVQLACKKCNLTKGARHG